MYNHPRINALGRRGVLHAGRPLQGGLSDSGPCVARDRGGSASHDMCAMDSTELIQKFLQDRLGTAPESIVPGARLADLGLDSLMLAELMFEAEDRFAISIPSDLQLPNTVGDMTALIDTLLASKASAS